MTIIPDKSYLENNGFEAFSSTYLKWQNGFKGYILYHNLDGSFSNGWKLSESLVEKPVDYAKLNQSNKSENCYYYFLVYTITECGSNITKGSKGCRTYQEWNYIGNDCEEGGGGSGGYTGYVQISLQDGTPNTNLIYDTLSTISPVQKQLVEEAIKGFLNEFSVYGTIFQTLANVGIRLKFEIDTTLTIGVAKIDGNTISFKNQSNITASTLGEELIHRYQTYRNNGVNPPSQNFEFEAKILGDILYYQKYGFQRASSVTSYFEDPYDVVAYHIWLEYIYDTGIIDQYTLNDFVSRWSYPSPYNGTCDYNFVPGVLNTFILPTGIIY